ncbi:hypothetical protein KZX32_05970 [Corynebacterium kefirresidentii]|uniref:hypothetical protein n=1 Tax=Corynebacterium kefirresidentii TaxID=1979527 RepID=UPI0020029ADD|nr:hypothetical protein [Corynebacterium kefirresidentii]MCK6083038.1 hypothetical protein [Corynebacterium kefirresidentii]
MPDIFQWVLELLIVLGVSGAIIGLIILAVPFVCHYVESYWGWADGLLNGREDAKNERS